MNIIMKVIFVSSLLFSFSACSVQPANKEKPKSEANALPTKIAPMIDPKNCICPQLWMPVCGENGKTYSNSCFANCAGVKFKQGSCSKVITD